MLVLYVLEKYTAGYSLCQQSRLLFNSVQSTESVVVNYTGQNQSKIKAEVWNYGHEAGIH